MSKFARSLAVSILCMGLSLPALAQTTDGTKSPTDPTVPAEKMPIPSNNPGLTQPGTPPDAQKKHGKTKKPPTEHPPTQQMDKAVSPGSTGDPETPANPAGQPPTTPVR